MSDGGEKKIIIDEDWKSQVQAEKEQQKQTGSSGASVDGGETTPGGSPDSDEMQIPPASIPVLISSIATQAMFAMGQIPDPSTGQPMLDLNLAKHHVDMLSVLDAKTKGNLDDEESKMLTEALHQLRMAFVAIEEQVAKANLQ